MYTSQMNKSNPAITVKHDENLSTPEFIRIVWFDK